MSDLIDLKMKQLELAAQAADKLAVRFAPSGGTAQAIAKKNAEHWLEVFRTVYDGMAEASKG
jgi:hypothetical protein